MARIAGRNGIIYVGLTSAGVPSPLAYCKTWSLNFTTNKIKVTAFGDVTEVYVAGLPDCQGQLAGYYDDASVQTYTAATDGIARKFYMYPSTLTSGQYWYGTGIFDFSANAAVDGAVEMTASFAAASVATKIG